MEEIIDEPVLDASHYTFVTASSELMQYYYKLKYPDTYNLSSSTVLKLLDNEQVYSDLKRAVSSFVEQAQKLNKGSASYNMAENKSLELPVYDSNWASFSVNEEESLFRKPANLFPGPSSSTGVPLYDSVHSIKMPLRTYDRKLKPKVIPYHNHRKCQAAGKRMCPTVAKVTKQMSELVFDRVDQSLAFPLSKTAHPISSVWKKGECLSVSPSNRKQINKVSPQENFSCKAMHGFRIV